MCVGTSLSEAVAAAPLGSDPGVSRVFSKSLLGEELMFLVAPTTPGQNWEEGEGEERGPEASRGSSLWLVWCGMGLRASQPKSDLGVSS